MGKKKKDKPILSKEEKDAKKALKKKNQKERVKNKRERKESNRRKRVEEESDEEALASPRSTTSKKMKKSKMKQEESPTSKIKKADKKRAKKLKKLEKLRKPLKLTKEEQDRVDALKTKRIIAWWDYENLPYPWIGVYKMLLKKLRAEGYTGDLELHAIVGYKGDPEPKKDKTFTMHYGDLEARPKVGTKRNQKADNHMRSLITEFLKEERAPQNTLLITNDNGFRGEMDSLRAAGHGVLLATMQESLIIKSRCHKVWFWKNEIVNED